MYERRFGRLILWSLIALTSSLAGCMTGVPSTGDDNEAPSEGLALTTGTLPVGQVGDAFIARIAASGGIAPYEFARSRGDALPEGLALDPHTGEISGMPAIGSGGAYFIDVSVTDSSDPPSTVERRLTLVIFERGNEFVAIKSWILPSCSASACHSSESHMADLVLEPEKAYHNIVGVPPQNAAAAAAGSLLVSPGDPASSFFLRKMTGDLAFGEGAAMPQAGVETPDEQIALVRQWIEEGAMPSPDGDSAGGNGADNAPGDQEPALKLGQIAEQIYAQLEDGDELQIWFGTQGGVWVLPTVRAVGLDTSVFLEFRLTSAVDGSLIGETSFTTDMTPTREGTELQNALVPIFGVLDLEGLFDTEAVLFCRLVDDEDNEATIEVTVILVPA